ncbi:hypothetical protein AAG570_013944 [Ranatra chinensis]|uniref:Uncharacterized protein n=1 Tax=Ranatra chinensis TaxID=642074 RepID=A0ABD0YQ89_9HEMI
MIVGEIELYLASCFLSLVCVMFIYFPVRSVSTTYMRSPVVIACSTPYQNAEDMSGFKGNISRIHVRSCAKGKSTEKKTSKVCRELFKPRLIPNKPIRRNEFLFDDERLLQRRIPNQEPMTSGFRVANLRQKGGGLRI